MAAVMFGNFPLHALKGDVDFDTATVKALLCTSGYTPNKDSHEFRSAVSSEASGSGYSAGGVTVSGVSVSLDAANDRVKLSCSNVNFGTVTLSGVTTLVFYISTGSANTDILISYHTFSAASPSATNFTATVGSDGIGYISYPG